MPAFRKSQVEILEDRRLFSGGLVADNSRLIFSAISGASPSAAQTVTLTNTSDAPVTVADGNESIDGGDADEFSVVGGDPLPVTIQPGATAAVSVEFSATRIGPAGAVLHVLSDDPDSPLTDITLRGLGTKGQFDTLEPSLQWILDTYQIPVNVGTSNPATNILDIVPLQPNDETPLNLMEKAGDGPVTVAPIAVYSSAASPALDLGFYNFAGGMLARTQAYSIPSTDIQTLNVHVAGSDQFDPGPSVFGLYTQWPGQKNRIVYSEDFRNTWQSDTRLKHAVRFYPMKNADGSDVPNTYVMAVEESTNHDYQDGVFVVSNVRLASPSQSPSSLGASATTARQMFLKWTDNSINESGFNIERATSGGPYLPLASVGSNVTKYTDSNLQPGTRYQYRVQAVGQDGVSDDAYSAATLVPVTYEAESALLSGPIVQKTYAGYTGAGYANFQHSTGDTIHWLATVQQPGAVTLTFRYALGAAARALKLTVNGAVVKSSLSFASTTYWTAWRTVNVTVSLAAGVNDIVLTSIGQGGPNIDSLQVH